MNIRTLGLHHVTAICSDAQRNVDFYAGTLGLRLVKLTVNFDDPSSYHLYYGDASGRPGSIMTFFAWPGAYEGRRGTEQVTATAFAVPPESLPFWKRRFEAQGVRCEEPFTRWGEDVLPFFDSDGLGLELVAAERNANAQPWTGSDVPLDAAIAGFAGVTLSEEGYERTARLLTETLGFHAAGENANRFRFLGDETQPGSSVEVLCSPGGRRGSMGAGTVHHVAFRAPDDATQRAWRNVLGGAGLNVSPVMDRSYFHSIYFREPGNVLFEIATDPPGFTADEPLESLGTHLKLPPWLEGARAQIETVVPSLCLPYAPVETVPADGLGAVVNDCALP